MDNEHEEQSEPSAHERAAKAQEEIRAVLAKYRCTLTYQWAPVEPIGDGHRALLSVGVGVVAVP